MFLLVVILLFVQNFYFCREKENNLTLETCHLCLVRSWCQCVSLALNIFSMFFVCVYFEYVNVRLDLLSYDYKKHSQVCQSPQSDKTCFWGLVYHLHLLAKYSFSLKYSFPFHLILFPSQKFCE